MHLLLSLSSLVLLKTFKLCVIAVRSSLLKVYALHVKCRYIIQTSDFIFGRQIAKKWYLDQVLKNISNRYRKSVLDMAETLKPNLAVQETAEEASEAQLLSYICLSLPSPRTINAEAMRTPVFRAVCINKTTAGLKALQEACSHHCFTSLRVCFCFVLFLSSCTYWERKEYIVDGVGSYPAGKIVEVSDFCIFHCQVKEQKLAVELEVLT